MAAKKVKRGRKMLARTAKRGRGRPPGKEHDAKLDIRMPQELRAQIDKEAEQSGVPPGTFVRQMVEAGLSPVASRVTKDEAAARAAERLQMYREALDSLYPDAGPMRDGAIQKWLADRKITPEMARELAKPTRKR
jgi:predicted DNA-binding protein